MARPMVLPLPPLPRPQHPQGEREMEREGKKEVATATKPPNAGPLAGLWRGEREEAARDLLTHTNRPVCRTTAGLGMHIHSAFRKCFSRWAWVKSQI